MSVHEKIVLLLLSFCLAACSAKPYVVEPSKNREIYSRKKIIVVNHGWHSGFVFPIEDMIKKLPLLKQRFGNARYLEFGWGDQAFYQAGEKHTGLTIQAIFWPTDTVIQVVALPSLPSEYYSDIEVIKACVSNQEYLSLIEFVVDSFSVNESGQIVEIKKGNYGHSQFYKGAGRYYLTNTCNKWTAKGLKSAGMDISPTFKLTSSSVMSYLRKQDQFQTNVSNEQSTNTLRSTIDCN